MQSIHWSTHSQKANNNAVDTPIDTKPTLTPRFYPMWTIFKIYTQCYQGRFQGGGPKRRTPPLSGTTILFYLHMCTLCCLALAAHSRWQLIGDNATLTFIDICARTAYNTHLLTLWNLSTAAFGGQWVNYFKSIYRIIPYVNRANIVLIFWCPSNV